ncbi:MAG: TonB-dependent receptor, partial [Bacteroidia bacterium]
YLGYEEKTEKIIVSADLPLTIKMKVSTGKLNEVIVSAGRYDQEIKRVTVSTEIIKPYLIENKITTNLQYFLDQVPSVNVVDGQLNIRGGSGWTYGAGSRVMVLLDDLPFLSGDGGQAQWKFLPTENLQQLEVIKGASSVLYGSSAMDGIINLRTADPKSTPVTSFTPLIGWYSKPSNDSLKWTNAAQLQRGFNAFHSQKIKDFDLTLAANYLKDDGYRMGEDDNRLRFSIKTKYHSKKYAGLTYGLNGSAMYQESSSFLLWNGFPTGGLVSLNEQKTTDKSWNISFDPHLDFFAFGLKHKVRMRYLNISNNLQSPDSTPNQSNASWMAYSEYQVQKDLPKQLGVITGGLAGNYTQSNSPLFGGVHTSSNFAPFLQADLRYKRISFNLGSRWENYKMEDNKDSRLIFRTGLNIEITKSTFFRTSYGEGYRYPSIAERYIQTTVGTLHIFPNNSLQPESGWNYEAGIKQGFRIGNWQGFADAAYFITQYNNMMEFDFAYWKSLPSSPTLDDALRSLGFKSVNIGRTQIDGFDFSLGGEGKMGPIDVKIISGFTFMNPVSLEPNKVFAIDSSNQNKLTYHNTSTDTTNNILKYRYQQLAKVDLQVGYKKLSFGVSLKYNSYMKNIDTIFVNPALTAGGIKGVAQARELNTSGDFTWDVRVNYEFNKHIKAGVVIYNLFNHEMMTRPADLRPPRLVMFQMTFRI